MENIIAEQESEILRLLNEDSEKTIEIDTKALENSMKQEVELLETEILNRLNHFYELHPIISISTVQSYSKIDEEISQNISSYTKTIDLALSAIDVSVFQQCLRSDRAEEFSELCQEKKKLEILASKCLKQLVLANAGHEKYKTAMKSFEEIVLKEENIKKVSDIKILTQKNLEENKSLNENLQNTLKTIDKIINEIEEINVDLIEFENIDFLVQKNEFFHQNFRKVQKILENQKRFNILGLCGMIVEQEEIQQEYDRLFEIQNFFEDLSSQMNFRTNYYKNFKIRAELQADERKTVDERDFFYKSL